MLKDLLKANDMRSAIVQLELDRLFVQWNAKKGPRTGLHASSIVAEDSSFCFREQVMGFHYRKAVPVLTPKTLRIFKHGWHVHEKWQDLFVSSGVAIDVETTRKSKMWGVYLTPDAVIRLHRKTYVVEIKSMHTYGFSKLSSPPANAIRQVQFYMHMCGLPQGIVLVEDKNSQDFKVWVVDYDPAVARPFIERLYRIQRLNDEFNLSGKLPKRICSDDTTRRAQQCPLREACFASKIDREQFRQEEALW